MPQDLGAAVLFFFGAAVMCFAYGYVYRTMKVDRFREDIFTIRDEVFDYMWKHDLPYDHPAYVNMRTLLNGTIRFAGNWCLPVFILMAWHARRTPNPNVLGDAIKTLQEEHRTYFERVRERIWHRLLAFMFREGLCGWIANAARRIGRGGFTAAMDSLGVDVTDELVMLGRSRSKLGRMLFDEVRPAF